MSYAMSEPLQTAVFNALQTDETLLSLVGTDIYDAMPSGTLPATYVRLGAETAWDASDNAGSGALHRFTVTVVTTEPGFAGAKAVSGAISDVLHGADLPLSRGRLVILRFVQAVAARRDGGSTRQIDLRFRARVSDD